MNVPADMKRLQLGVAYYPEQDPEAEWELDARLMRDLGLDTVRIGEFAWSRMEQPDGTFTLDWIDRCITLFHRHGIRTILCTPTATPPVWLCDQCTRSPQHVLAYNRFCHEGMADYLLLQAEAVRRHVGPDRFLVASAVFPVLHQLYRLQRDRGVNGVDSVTVHHYPELMPEPGQPAMHLDLMRALDSRLPFRALEHQVGSGYSSAGGLDNRVRRCWSLETVAHGARTLLWFHWRRFRTGCEWRHTPVVERDRKPREVYHDLQSLAAELRRIDPILSGSRVAPGPQILSSYINAMARDRSSEMLFWMEIQKPDAYRERFPLWARETLRAAYNPFVLLGQNVTFVREDEDWSPDQPLVVPDLDICPEALARKLEAWCARGGTLICFPGAGERDAHGAHLEAPPPGSLAGLFGADHAHYFPMSANRGSTFNHMAGTVLATTGVNPETAAAPIRFGGQTILFDVRHGEVLAVREARVLGVYADGPYAGEPAVTVRPIGKGRAIYLGAVPKTAADAAAFYRLILPGLPEVDIPFRRIRWTGPQGSFAFLVNDTPAPVPLPAPVHDQLTDRTVTEIPPFGVLFHQE